MLTYGLSKRLLVLAVIYNTVSAAFMFAGIHWGAIGIALSNVVTIVVVSFLATEWPSRFFPISDWRPFSTRPRFFLLPRGRREIMALISALVTSFKHQRDAVGEFDAADSLGLA